MTLLAEYLTILPARVTAELMPALITMETLVVPRQEALRLATIATTTMAVTPRTTMTAQATSPPNSPDGFVTGSPATRARVTDPVLHPITPLLATIAGSRNGSGDRSRSSRMKTVSRTVVLSLSRFRLEACPPRLVPLLLLFLGMELQADSVVERIVIRISNHKSTSCEKSSKYIHRPSNCDIQLPRLIVPRTPLEHVKKKLNECPLKTRASSQLFVLE